jgi:hypothetical protein
MAMRVCSAPCFLSLTRTSRWYSWPCYPPFVHDSSGPLRHHVLLNITWACAVNTRRGLTLFSLARDIDRSNQMRLLPFHSTSRDNRRQLRLARNLYPVKTQHPTGRSHHQHYHLHSCHDHQRPCCHLRDLRTRPRGASRLLHLLSPHLLTSLRARRGLGNDHACQARSIHIPTLLITHNLV